VTKETARKADRDREVKIVDLSNAMSKKNVRKFTGALLVAALVVCAVSAAVAQGLKCDEQYLDDLPTDGEDVRIIPWDKPAVPQCDSPENAGCRSRLPV
jgi:hypothetical protein